jgi:YfiH family protein
MGGVSERAFASLNSALHVGDDPEHVKQNRQTISAMLVLPAEPCWLQQVHSNIAVECSTILPPMQADACYTRAAGVVCAVMTADCLPVLVCAEDGSAIAAIHAGWRGLHTGIISNTLAAMPKQNYLVWLGPAIGPNCFEVGSEVREAFVEKSSDYLSAFKGQAHSKWLADIYQLARVELVMLGIAESKIYGGGFCTMTEAEHFYSYRRDQQTGRMATLIWRAQ